MSLGVFEWLTDTQVQVPPRARLHPVPPIGVGTAMVQSLPSYIHRLALSHGLPTSIFASKILAPRFARQTVATTNGTCDLLNTMGATTLGNNTTAAETVNILQELTGVLELKKLTLINFGTAVGEPLIRTNQAWCPACLEELRKREDGIYQPLLWSIRHVEVCPTHNIRLQNACPSCGKEHRPLTRHQWNGRCPTCKTWLGGTESKSEPPIQWKLRTAERMAEAIIHLQQRDSPFQGSAFAENIARLIQTLGVTVSRLAKLLQVHHSTVGEWIRASQMPSLSYLSRLSCALNVPVLHWLDRPLAFSPASAPIVPTSETKRALRRHNLKIVQAKLEEVVKANAFPSESLTAISKRLGIGKQVISRSFPELARILIDRRKQHYATKDKIRRRFQKLLLESAFNKLLISGIFPTGTQMTKVLPRSISFRDRYVREEFDRLRTGLDTDVRSRQTKIAGARQSSARNHKVAATGLDP